MAALHLAADFPILADAMIQTSVLVEELLETGLHAVGSLKRCISLPRIT